MLFTGDNIFVRLLRDNTDGRKLVDLVKSNVMSFLTQKKQFFLSLCILNSVCTLYLVWSAVCSLHFVLTVTVIELASVVNITSTVYSGEKAVTLSSPELLR